MTRHLTRAILLCAGAAALCLAGPGSAHGQGGSVDLKQFRMEDVPSLPGDALSRMLDLRSGKLKVGGPDQKVNQALFKQMATHYAQKVTHAQYYTYPETGELSAKIPSQTLDFVMNELANQLLAPTATTQFSTDQAEYIREFGAALDAAIVDVLTRKRPPNVIRVNAARMLAVAARSGAPAHAPTILALLTNKFYVVDKKPLETPPEVMFWAIRAAEHLLAAHDPVAFRLPGSPPKHSIPEADLVRLVQVLEDLVLKGPNVADKAASLESEKTVRVDQKAANPAAPPVPAGEPAPAPAPKDAAPAGKPTAAPKGSPPAASPPGPMTARLDASPLAPEQVALVVYFRKAAVRALAKVRYDSIGGEAGVPLVRPGLTLARVAVNDTALSLPATTAEIGEAVIGLCGLQPSPALNQAEWLYAIVYGTYLFAQPKSGDGEDKSVHWRLYAARMQAALAGLNAASKANPRLRGNQKAVQGVTAVLTTNVLAPLEKAGAGVAQINLDALNTWLGENVPPDRNLFTEPPTVRLAPRPAGG